MNQLLTLVLALLLLTSCGKDPVPNRNKDMIPANVHDAVVNDVTDVHLDMNGDGIRNLSFETMLIDDAAGQSKRLYFLAIAKHQAFLLSNEEAQAPVFSKGEDIKAEVPGRSWYSMPHTVLAVKVTPVTGTPYWEGSWKGGARQYLPIQVGKNGAPYFGWVELSLDTATSKLVVHHAALSNEPGKEIRAGY